VSDLAVSRRSSSAVSVTDRRTIVERMGGSESQPSPVASRNAQPATQTSRPPSTRGNVDIDAIIANDKDTQLESMLDAFLRDESSSYDHRGDYRKRDSFTRASSEPGTLSAYDDEKMGPKKGSCLIA
jgi:hypothetical protein